MEWFESQTSVWDIWSTRIIKARHDRSCLWSGTNLKQCSCFEIFDQQESFKLDMIDLACGVIRISIKCSCLQIFDQQGNPNLILLVVIPYLIIWIVIHPKLITWNFNLLQCGMNWNILLIISTIFSSHLHWSILYDWCLFVHIRHDRSCLWSDSNLHHVFFLPWDIRSTR